MEGLTMKAYAASNDAVRPLMLDRRQMRFGRRRSEFFAEDYLRSELGRREESPLSLDVRCKSITLDGNSLHLTKKEYLLLCAFLASPGTVFSSRELVKQLGPDCPPQCMEAKAAEIKQFIYTLRGKIDKAAGKRSWIETVRGFGYRLADIH
jgi:DNA-binding response OmpR family regulator